MGPYRLPTDPLSQRTPGEVDVAVEPIELRDDDWTCQPADHLESRGKLRPALKRVAPLPVSTSVKVSTTSRRSAPATARAVPSIKYRVAGSGDAI
jgi:hypothetical protein